MSLSKPRVLFMMSGSIAAFKACQVISLLVKAGHEVQVVATKSTFEFVGAMTLEGLTGKKVLSDLWEQGRAMDHIHLTRWADYAVLCPASANTLAKFAGGFAEDLVGAMALAWPMDKKFWIFPAMNRQMLANPATRENLEKLSARGFSVAPTQEGSLACGEEGPGRMLEAEAIFGFLAENRSRRHLLITGGATREPIDGIRFISNVSTGQTSATLAEGLFHSGFDVTFLHGMGCAKPLHAQAVEFSSFADLDEKLRSQLAQKEFLAVIHCAAVSDYTPETPNSDVKFKTAPELTLKLKANHKILPRLKEYSRNKAIRVIGFKLTLNESAESAAKQMLSSEVDAVVANEWSSVTRDRTRHPGTLVTNRSEQTFNDLHELNRLLSQYILGGLDDSLS